MRILITTEFYYPYAGGSIFLQKVAEGLVKKGHQVNVATAYLPERKELSVNGVIIKQFKISGNLVKGMSGEIEAYKNLLRSNGFDVMINFAANIWTTDLALQLVDEIKAKKILTTPGLSKLGQPKYDLYYQKTYLPAVKKYDRVVYTSFQYKDKLFGDAHGLGDKAVLIPNGAGEEFLQPSKNFKERYGIKTKHMLVSISNHYLAKGHWFVIRAFLKLQRKDTTLVIIGNRPGRHSWYSCYPLCWLVSKLNPRIKSFSHVPRADVVSAFQEADLYLFGSKVECAPLVLYEALASKTPMISTAVGNIPDYKEIVKIVSTPLEMAKATSELLANNSERTRIAEKGFELWQSNYTWDKIVDKYAQVVAEI